MKAHRTGLKAIVAPVVAAKFLCEQLLPAIAGLWVCRIGIFFAQWSYVGAPLLVLTIHTRGRREQKPADSVQAAGFQHMRVDQDVIAGDVSVKGGDVTNAPHIGGQVVDLIDTAASGLQTVIPAAEIENFKFIRLAGFIFRILDINAADETALSF